MLVACLLKAKGIREYVEAATQVKQKYPNARFIIIGYKDSSPDAIPESMIESWATSDVISYEGGVKDVRPFVTRASVCVLPSYSEGLPRTVLEALAMNQPVYVFCVGAVLAAVAVAGVTGRASTTLHKVRARCAS